MTLIQHRPVGWSRISLGIALWVWLSLGGCMASPNSAESVSPESSVSAESPESSAANRQVPPSASPSSGAPAEALPDTKMATMSLEGESEEVQMHLYNEPSLPVMTYLPGDNFTPELSESDEGTGVRFYWTYDGKQEEKAYIQLAFPKNQTSVADLQAQITGEAGLIATNGWDIIDQTDDVPYPWAKQAIAYNGTMDGTPITGYILIGEHNGSAFYASTHFPLEYGDGFGPRATLVFENLTFRE